MAAKYAKAVEASNTYAKSGDVASNNYVATNLPGYHMHPTLSDNQSVVLHSDTDPNDVIIAYRGTVHPFEQQHPIEGFEDYFSDGIIAAGLPSFMNPRINEAEQKYMRVSSVYPDANVKVTGHSLGGAESYKVATKYNLEGHHFDIGSSPVSKIPFMLSSYIHDDDERYTKQNIYHTDNYKALGNVYAGADPVSETSKHLPGNHIIYKQNTGTNLSAHSLSHFIRDDHFGQINMSPNIKWKTPGTIQTNAFNPKMFKKSPKKRQSMI